MDFPLLEHPKINTPVFIKDQFLAKCCRIYFIAWYFEFECNVHHFVTAVAPEFRSPLAARVRSFNVQCSHLFMSYYTSLQMKGATYVLHFSTKIGSS